MTDALKAKLAELQTAAQQLVDLADDLQTQATYMTADDLEREADELAEQVNSLILRERDVKTALREMPR